jgi:hypothetical protein
MATVRSLDKSWVTVGWGEPIEQCGTRLEDPELARVLAVLESLDKPQDCPPCDGCVPYTMLWSIAPNRNGEHMVTDRCLTGASEFSDLGDALTALHRATAPRRQCLTLES